MYLRRFYFGRQAVTPFFITIATACYTVAYYGWEMGGDAHKHRMYKEVCIEQVVSKSSYSVMAKPGETVFNVVDREWLEKQIAIINAAQGALSKTTDYYFAEADRTYCDRHGEHKWKKVWLSWAPESIAEKCDICHKIRRKAKKEEWIEEPIQSIKIKVEGQ